MPNRNKRSGWAFFVLGEILSHFVKYHPNRTIFSANMLVNGLGEDTLVCINRDVLPLLIEFLATDGTRENSFWYSQTAHGYTTPNKTDWNIISNIIAGAVYSLQTGFDMGICDQLVSSLGLINTTLETLTATLSTQTQVQASTGCGCGSTGTNPNPIDASIPCLAPPGFGMWGDYITYSCRFVNWYLEKLQIALRQIEQSQFWMYYDYSPNGSEQRMSTAQIYQRIASFDVAVVPLEWLYNWGDASRTEFIRDMTNLYTQFRTDKFNRVPEFDPVQDVIDDWYAHAGLYADYIAANLATITQTLFDATDISTFMSEVSDLITDMRVYADAVGDGLLGADLIEDMATSLTDIGVAGLGWAKSTAINIFDTVVPCTGNKGCCPLYSVVTGVDLGGGEFQSVYTNGAHTIDMINNAYGILDLCGGIGQWGIPSGIIGSPDQALYYDDADVLQSTDDWPITSPNCIRRVKFIGTSAFTIAETVTEVCT